MIPKRKAITHAHKLSVRGAAFAALIACSGILSVSLLHFHSAAVPRKDDHNQMSPVRTGGTALSKNERRRRQLEACRRMKSVKDIQTCYLPQFVRPLNSTCKDIDDWQDVQRCLTGRLYAQNETDRKPFVIHILGERHSGTKFVMHELQQCFLQPSAVPFVQKVHRDFLRVKHFFQPLVRDDFRRHIVVVIVRDPLDWVAAMHEKPYHSPAHIAGYDLDETSREVIPLPWQDFVSRPWTTHRSHLDKELKSQQQGDPKLRTKPVCQENFAFHEVVPCQVDNVSYAIPRERMRGFTPFYEMRRDGSGNPYEHILQLRSDKIVNFVLQLPMIYRLGGFVVVRYEDLLQNGSRFLMEQFARIVGMQELPSECHPVEPQPERLQRRFIPDGLRQWVEEHLDTGREKLLGYR